MTDQHDDDDEDDQEDDDDNEVGGKRRRKRRRAHPVIPHHEREWQPREERPFCACVKRLATRQGAKVIKETPAELS